MYNYELVNGDCLIVVHLCKSYNFGGLKKKKKN